MVYVGGGGAPKEDGKPVLGIERGKRGKKKTTTRGE